MHIFISHSSRDAEFADSVCRLLEGSGHNCFIAPRDIRPGREYAEEIIDGITGADIMLLVVRRIKPFTACISGSGESCEQPRAYRSL